MIEEILTIMREIFELPEEHELKEDTTQKELLIWDSLMQMRLIATLEERYAIKFDFMDLITMNSAKAIEKVIKEKLQKAGK